MPLHRIVRPFKNHCLSLWVPMFLAVHLGTLIFGLLSSSGIVHNGSIGPWGGGGGAVLPRCLSELNLGRGGIEVRNLPQFYCNFSVMPLFKNFNFPLRKNLSLPLLSLGTLYVSVFSSVLHVISVAGRFSVFVFPKCRLLLGTVILARATGQ